MDLIRFRAKAGKDIEAILAEKSEKKPDHSVFYDLRDSKILPPEEKTISRLQDEVRSPRSNGYSIYSSSHHRRSREANAVEIQ